MVACRCLPLIEVVAGRLHINFEKSRIPAKLKLRLAIAVESVACRIRGRGRSRTHPSSHVPLQVAGS